MRSALSLLWGFATERFVWKLLSLIASVILWMAFAGETEIATSVPVNVQYRGVPANLEVSSEHLDRLFLKVRGPAARLTAASLAQTRVVLDFEDVHVAGQRTFTISDANLDLPSGISLIRVVPSQIRVVVEGKLRKDVPVVARFSGTPYGYRVAAQQITPDRVPVTGPDSRVRRIREAETDLIDLSSAVGNQQFRVAAYLPDPQVQFDGDPPSVWVRVALEKIP